MERSILAIIILSFAALLLFFQEYQTNQSLQPKATLEGFIIMKEGEVYLVEDPDFVQQDADKFTIHELRSKYKMSKLWIKGFSTLKGIKNGQKVKVWYSEILESYPGKVKVLKIEPC
ncbi:DUF3221 domain-containing protein [Parageobacillus thermoglucosidasius]|uniref:DUF3221 domain-containing protein n=3 Tax=Anoxybacillaceae TaxID=3120669 RepID=A0AB38QTG6_PARTM|nr:DUF3221 domain-containing protein [Parageobacillus thermoglucosidasius]KYD18302.1 hypothetical protein B4168_0271 [Anoxybacillus flavithermus]REK53548.1 MAG: DUF3221 domain-containing protein [Geobacillus sp.]AEH47863.1 hypothetical protein Geoth_1901 [Parageobacillus thermoglucosidasius C56-YS93]EID44422.1 hypothetical protein, DUF3221 family [Parageobacillus thermoglucosidasius TNO-09.020]MBY6270191.1 DUF3221 domain-containing protein [Parageobacillus thermoglucosidasius]